MQIHARRRVLAVGVLVAAAIAAAVVLAVALGSSTPQAARPAGDELPLRSQLKQTLLAARSIGYSSGPSGVYLAELFLKWGIADELKPKTTQTPPGTAVGPLIARGEVEIGFQQMSELLPTPGIDILGPLPAELQVITTFSGGVHVAAKQADAANAWLAFLASQEAAPVLRRHGMEPA